MLQRRARKYPGRLSSLRLVLHLLLLLVVLPVGAAVRVQLKPEQVFVGETAVLTLISDRSVPRDAVLPKIEGVSWLGGPSTSQRTNWVNNTRSFTGTASFPVRFDNAGTFRLQGLRVRENGRLVSVPSVTVEVKERRFQGSGGNELTMDDALRVEARYDSPDGSASGRPSGAYVGEQVPLTVRVLVLEQLAPNFAYPALTVENAVVHDYSTENPDSSQFDVGTVRSVIQDGLRFRVATFRTSLTPLAVGALTANGSVEIRLTLASNRRDFFDDFMMLRPGSNVRRELTFALPALDVRALPDVPQTAGHYLGLVGDWQVRFAASDDQVRVGHPLTVTMTVSGKGGASGLQPPELDIANYRSYKPETEVSETGEEIVVTWALIPLSLQAGKIAITVATFNAETGQYEPHAFTHSVDILEGELSDSGVTVFDPGGAAGEGRGDERGRVSSLLYIKDSPGSGVALPLWRNIVLPAGGLAVLGTVVFAGAHLLVLLGMGRFKSPEAARRDAALKRRSQVLRGLRASAAGEVGDFARREAVPLISDLCGCPPGTTALELAQRTGHQDPELAASLRALDHDEFAPSGDGKCFDAAAFADAIRRLSCWVAFALAGFAGLAADGMDAETRFRQAVEAYDAGSYAKAGAIFAELGRVDAEDPVLLYNMANCAFENGEPARALALYERAALLAPRDSDITENLDYVRNQLGLPTYKTARNPGELVARLRDSLRPDEWMLIAALWFCGSLCWSAVLIYRRGRWMKAFAVALVGALVILGICGRQLATTYRRGSKAVVASRQANAFHHPSTTAKKSQFVPLYGECAEIIEKRTGWSLIRSEAGEGWVEDSDLAVVW